MKAGKLEIGVLRLSCCEALLLRGKRKKEEARRSVFTNMRCSPFNTQPSFIFSTPSQQSTIPVPPELIETFCC